VSLPDPLTPPDCDLRDFAYMPLDVLRLRDSDLAARTTGEEFRCAVLLWCASWHQVPAASLPNDDVNLAQYSGFGRAIDEWLKVREGALRGWILCADGRLYHPTVAEKANESWIAKHRRAHENLVDRIRKKNKTRSESGLSPLEVPPLDQWIDMGLPLERELFPAEFGIASAGKKGKVRRKSDDIPAAPCGSTPEDCPTPPSSSAEDNSRAPPDASDLGAFGVSDGNIEKSGGTPTDSAGTKDNAAGKTSENLLNGTERIGEVNTIGTVIATVDLARARDDDFKPKDAAEWLRYLRGKHGFEADPTSIHDRKKLFPVLAAWTNAGLTTGFVDLAIKRAHDEATETIGCLPLYVDRVIASMQSARTGIPNAQEALEANNRRVAEELAEERRNARTR
jgi:hypothetical protein